MYSSELQDAGKQHYLGRFAEEQDAADAVRAAREAADAGRFEEHLAGLREAGRERVASGDNALTGSKGTSGTHRRIITI